MFLRLFQEFFLYHFLKTSSDQVQEWEQFWLRLQLIYMCVSIMYVRVCVCLWWPEKNKKEKFIYNCTWTQTEVLDIENDLHQASIKLIGPAERSRK